MPAILPAGALSMRDHMTPKVLDLSHFDPKPDWESLIHAGIVGVIQKATDGASFVDPTYASRRAEVLPTRLLFGAYHFWRPGDAVTQARHFLSVLASSAPAPLLAVDYEVPGGTIGDLISFIQQVEIRAGKKMVVYGNKPYLGEQLAAATEDQFAFFAARRLWWAEYEIAEPVCPKCWAAPWLWQYSEDGKVPGVNAKVDLNHFNETDAELIAQWDA